MRVGLSHLIGEGLVFLGVTIAAAQPATRSATETSYARARPVLDKAITAMGGLEALQSIRDVSRDGTGTAYNQGQSLVPDPPYTTRPVTVTSIVDLANRRSATETATTPQGGIPSKARAVLAGEGGFAVNLVTRVTTPSTAAGLGGLRTALRRDPAALLVTANARAETLRYLGEEAYAGAPQEVIAFADSDGTQIALYVDAKSGLLSKYETLADNPVLGDILSEVVFSDYRPVGSVKLPFRVESRAGGEVTLEMQYAAVRINTEPTAALFEAPRDVVTGEAAGPPSRVSVRKLADDVYLAEGSSHHSLFVAFADHVVLIEAPQNAERTEAVLAKIVETVPGKPVRYVVVTHHHYDHTGGLRAAIAAGATVITTPGNRALVERLAKAPHTIRPDALARLPRSPAIETFTRRRILTDGSRTIELHDIGPNPHVREAVIAYLPKEKIAFQSDLVGLPSHGPLPPASPATVDFVGKVQKLGLAVETIVGGHGRVGTMAEVVRAADTAK